MTTVFVTVNGKGKGKSNPVTGLEPSKKTED